MKYIGWTQRGCSQPLDQLLDGAWTQNRLSSGRKREDEDGGCGKEA